MRRGQFRPGPDPRRHRFTLEECRRGFHAAEASLARRFPGADTHFLICALIGSKPWYTLPEFQRLLDRDEPINDAESLQLFCRDEL